MNLSVFPKCVNFFNSDSLILKDFPDILFVIAVGKNHLRMKTQTVL